MKCVGENIYIRLWEISDAEDKLQLHLRNKEFFQRYSPTRDEDFYTLEGQIKIIKNNIELSEIDERYAFGIFLNSTDELIGGIGLSGVIRGHLQSCNLGYYLDQQHNGKGFMTEAVQLTVNFAFKELEFHRIEAGVMPRNTASMKVLERAGFHKEGIAVKNVKINDKWEDHQILAIIAEE